MDEGYQWLIRIAQDAASGFASAERWITGLVAVIEEEARLCADPEVSVGRPRAFEGEGEVGYRLLYRPAGRNSTPWHVIYDLRDDDEDGVFDTLRVLRIQHARRGGTS